MNGQDDGASTRNPEEDTEVVRVECAADGRDRGLDVEWTKGAVFEFGSRHDAEKWLVAENRAVPGTLYLSAASDSNSRLPVDFYVKYSGPD